MFFKNCAKFTGKHRCWSLFLLTLQAQRSITLLKRESNKGVILWILRNLKFVQYTIHWYKIQMLKKISSGQNKRYKKRHSFFFRELQLIPLLLLISNSYTSWSIWFISLKLWVRFFIFNSILFLLNLILLFSKKHGLFDFLTLKRHNSFQKKKIEKPHTVLLPDLWVLSCNKKFENSMISVQVGAPKKLTWRRTF